MGGFDDMTVGGGAQGEAAPAAGPSGAVGPSALEAKGLSYRYGGGATFATRAYSEPKLIDVNCAFEKGCRVLVSGANGAGKSTLLSIMGGKKMVPRDQCRVLGKAAFHDSTLNRERMYCGDWWRTDFFFNISVAELIGEEKLKSERVQKLIDIMQINVSWRINAISDGQRRRCQLLECLADEKSVYILDEITTDLDLFAREGLLRFLREETEEKGATVFYATHIFDHLAEWATHLLFFSQAKVAKCCRMEDLTEYKTLVEQGTRVPLYTLMKEWIFKEYAQPPPREKDADMDMVPADEGPALETKSLTYAYAGGSPQLSDVSFSFCRGARILVVGANGAGKSTLLSILGGKRMIPRGYASVLGKDAFNDSGVAANVMYCGDWWRTNFFMNLKVREMMGPICESERAQHLVGVLQVNIDWKINDLSDGQRRRCQLLELLATPREMYLMDEITSDLDLFAREGILNFMRSECEARGATIFYCTHIFDHLEGWATHLLHLSQGRVVRHCRMEEVEEYSQLMAAGDSTPLYSLIRRWIYGEYGDNETLKPWRKLNESLDGRIPTLGLAGPFQNACG
jgi:CCR4-NOT complex subunit CAF16